MGEMCASCVELVTFDQLLRRYPQLEQHRIAPTGGAFCRAERLKGGGAAGTYAMPRPMAPTGDKHFFGFFWRKTLSPSPGNPRVRPAAAAGGDVVLTLRAANPDPAPKAVKVGLDGVPASG